MSDFRITLDNKSREFVVRFLTKRAFTFGVSHGLEGAVSFRIPYSSPGFQEFIEEAKKSDLTWTVTHSA